VRRTPPGSDAQRFDVAVIHARLGSADAAECVPTGHCLNRTRFRHLGESERIVVRRGGDVVGLAAYRHADAEIRVVHEFLLDCTLIGAAAASVTDILLSSLEMVAYEEGVRCLTFLLRGDVVMGPFECRGYTSLALDSSGTWLQRKLGWLGWCASRSTRPT